VQKSGANDRFLVNPTIRWRGQEWLLRVGLTRSTHDKRAAGFGAFSPFSSAPTKVF
jgi:hypothetical protein